MTVYKAPKEYLAWLRLLGDCWAGTATTCPEADGLLYMRLVRRWEMTP